MVARSPSALITCTHAWPLATGSDGHSHVVYDPVIFDEPLAERVGLVLGDVLWRATGNLGQRTVGTIARQERGQGRLGVKAVDECPRRNQGDL